MIPLALRKSTVWPKRLVRLSLILLVLSPVLLYGINVLHFLIPYLAAQQRWEASRPQRYTLVMDHSLTLNRPWNSEETVHEDALTSSRDRPDYLPQRPAIDWMFERIRACMFNPFELGLLMCSVEYDQDFGFPSKYRYFDAQLIRVVAFSPNA